MHSTYNNEDYENEQKDEEMGDEDTIVVDLVPPYVGFSPPKVSSPTEKGKFYYIIMQAIFSNH